MTEKEKLRKAIKARIAALTREECLSASKIIADKLFMLKEYREAKVLFVYNSFGCEVITDAIIMDALNSDKKVCVPSVEGERMQAVVIDKKTSYRANVWGIMEPLSEVILDPYEIELSLIPLVGFDKNLNRLGRGKGYYDKFLAGLPTRKIALAYSVQEAPTVETDVYDVKVDKIITEKEIIG